MSHQEGVGAGNDVVYSKQPSNVMVNFLEDTCGSAGASFTYKGQVQYIRKVLMLMSLQATLKNDTVLQVTGTFYACPCLGWCRLYPQR